MGTLSGQALAAIRSASPVLLRDAVVPPVPGWLVLSVRGDDGALYVANSDDLDADVELLRRGLLDTPSPVEALLEVSWVAARTILGDDAANVRARRAIEAVFLAHLKPEWPGVLARVQGVRFSGERGRLGSPEGSDA